MQWKAEEVQLPGIKQNSKNTRIKFPMRCEFLCLCGTYMVRVEQEKHHSGIHASV